MTLYQQISANQQKTYMIMALFVIIFTGLFSIIGWYMNNPIFYLVLGFVIALGSAFFSYFYSDKLVLSTTGAKPASKEQYFDFYTVTENLCIASGLPMPKIYVIHDPAPNAFATGRNPDHAVVCATTGLLKTLDRGELEGVVAHELAHVQNRDILVMSIVAVLVGSIAIITDIALRAFIWGGSDNRKGNIIMLVVFVLAMILTPIVAQLIKFAISRRREYLADATGALMTRNPEGLASALEKISAYNQPMRKTSSATAHLFISNPLSGSSKGMMGWFNGLFRTHPPVEDRIRILRST